MLTAASRHAGGVAANILEERARRVKRIVDFMARESVEAVFLVWGQSKRVNCSVGRKECGEECGLLKSDWSEQRGRRSARSCCTKCEVESRSRQSTPASNVEKAVP